jgi:death-on-curing protein
MVNPVWVPRVAVDAAHFEQLQEHGGLHGVRDANALEAALARPAQRHIYDENAGLADLAAAYLFGLARGHPYADGNKRTALDVAIQFLGLNGYEFDESVTDELIVKVVLAVAAGDMAEATLAGWIRERLAPLPPELFSED